MTNDRKKELFNRYRQSFIAAGLDTTKSEAVLCPLCWKEVGYSDLSIEHIVPRSVGGNRCILTCTMCNNKHGSMFDSHIAQFQDVHGQFKGHGTIRATIPMYEKQIAANIEWGDGYKHIKIIGEASDSTSVSKMQNEFKSGNISKLKLRLHLGYVHNLFQKGLLRCAYLAVFNCYGYKYAKQEVVQVIRCRICDPSIQHPRLGSLIGELQNFKIPFESSHFIVNGNADGVKFFFVIIRLRKQTTTYHFVFMPSLVDNPDEFYEIMERSSKDNNGKTFHIPCEFLFI